MYVNNKKRTFGLVLIIAATTAVFIGIFASGHAAALPAAPAKHVGSTNELAGSSSAASSQSVTSSNLKGGVCHRCVIAHPYEASLVGA
jgi:hypothetical protein